MLQSIIKRRQGSWVELHAPGELPLKLPAEQLPSSIRAGESIVEAEWEALRAQSEHALLLDSALRMLARREHFTRELENKLRQRSPDKSRVAAVLEECRQRGYLDDGRAAEATAESLLSRRGMGPGRLKGELFRRGCPPVLTEATMQEYGPRFDSDDTFDEALELARRRFSSRAQKTLSRIGELSAALAEPEAAGSDLRRLRSETAKEQRLLRQKFAQQLSAFLVTRGFGGDALRRGSSQLLAELLDQG